MKNGVQNVGILSCIKHGIQKIVKRFLQLTGIPNSSVLITLMVVFMLAFCAYGVVIIYIGPTPAISDAHNFHVTAQRLVDHGVYSWPNSGDQHVPNSIVLPGYVGFLALFYWLAPLCADANANFNLVYPFIVFTQLVMVSMAAVAIALSAYFIGGGACVVLQLQSPLLTCPLVLMQQLCSLSL